MTKVFVERHQSCFTPVFEEIGWTVVEDLSEADAVQLIGGADIDPSWYGRPAHPRTSYTESRDRITASLYEAALREGKAILGVCRGAQFINAVVGGGMYQDVEGHFQNHDVYDVETQEIVMGVNSIHHQMMIPHSSARKIAYCVPSLAKLHREEVLEDGSIVHRKVTDDQPEWEVLYYPQVRGLCFQSHPEYCKKGGPTRTYYQHLLRRLYPELF